MAKPKKQDYRYTVRCDWQPEQNWFVHIPAVHGCYTQANTLRQARKYIREVIDLMVSPKAAKLAVLTFDVRLPHRLTLPLATALKRRASVQARVTHVGNKLAASGVRAQDISELLRLG